MTFKHLIIIAAFVIFLRRTDAVCVRCPAKGINCNCPPPKLYDVTAKRCVTKAECSHPHKDTSPSQLKSLAPDIYDSLSELFNSLNLKNAKFHKGTTLILETLSEHLEEMKNNLVAIYGPALEEALAENMDLYHSCKGNVGCMIEQTVKKASGLEFSLTKLGEEFEEIIKDIISLSDNLTVKQFLEGKCDNEKNCPLKKIMELKKLILHSLEGLIDIDHIPRHLTKYFMFSQDDLKKMLKKYMSFGKTEL